jgi:predicted AAA+ superfamily ATPase
LLLINFEDERLLEVTHHDMQHILDAYYELFESEPIIFFDEIQNVPHWQKFVRRLADEGRRIYVTGSNAEMLSHEIATTLGGRFINKEILPLSFHEYLSFKDIQVTSKTKYSSERYKIIKEYGEYLHFGGFPELMQMKDKREFLSSVYQKLFYGDLIARYKVSNVVTLKLMVKKLAESVNNETSVNRIKNLIKSTGVSIGSNTLFDYLNYLESSYLIAAISNYHSKFTEKETHKKYYFLDTGILGLFLTDQPTKLLENQIYIELRRRGEIPYFLKRKTEVDFYIPENQELIQVSYSISDPETAKIRC